MKFVFVLATVLLAVVHVQAGRDYDDILERNLEKIFFPLGAKDVDVDDIDYQPGAFKVTITNYKIEKYNEENLKKALLGLGFYDARIERVSLGVKHGFFTKVYRDTFLVYLNVATYQKIMISISKGYY